jgi:hypothetical protein
MRMNGIRFEIAESHMAWSGPLTFGLILLAVLFPPIVLPFVCALAILIVLPLALPGSIPACVLVSHGVPGGLSPRSPPLA